MSQYFRHHGWVPARHSLIFALGMLSITMILTIVLFMTVETPCRRLSDRWFARPVVEPNEQQSRAFYFKG
jgi:peptidoglycan/LPS O-acetylase OafA/YrhL